MEFTLTNTLGHTALTLRGAQALHSSYQHLVGSTYAKDNEDIARIIEVAIAPFDDINKWLFLNNYTVTNDVVKALQFYQPPFYDVIAILKPFESDKLSYVDIRTYLQQAGSIAF